MREAVTVVEVIVVSSIGECRWRAWVMSGVAGRGDSEVHLFHIVTEVMHIKLNYFREIQIFALSAGSVELPSSFFIRDLIKGLKATNRSHE